MDGDKKLRQELMSKVKKVALGGREKYQSGTGRGPTDNVPSPEDSSRGTKQTRSKTTLKPNEMNTLMVFGTEGHVFPL